MYSSAYEQFAIISNFSNYAISTNGRVLNINTGRILKVYDNGYYNVTLINGKIKKSKNIQQLITDAFLTNNNNSSSYIYECNKKNYIWKVEPKNNNSSSSSYIYFNKKNYSWVVEIKIKGINKYTNSFYKFKDATDSRDHYEKIYRDELTAL